VVTCQKTCHPLKSLQCRQYHKSKGRHNLLLGLRSLNRRKTHQHAILPYRTRTPTYDPRLSMVRRHATKNRLSKGMDWLCTTTHCYQNQKCPQIYLRITSTSNGSQIAMKGKNTKRRSSQTGEQPPPWRISKTPEGILGTKSSTIPKETLLGSCHWPKTWCSKLSTRKGVLLNPTRTNSLKRIPEETAGKRLHQTIQKPICCPLLLHQKEKWRIATCPRLPKCKWMDGEELIPPPTHIRIDQPSKRSKSLLKVQCMMGVQQCPNQRRGWMEGSLYHQPRTIQTASNVL